MAASARDPDDLQKRISRVHTAASDIRSDDEQAKQYFHPSPSGAASQDDSMDKSPTQQGNHRRLVFTDPVAFRYLEEDPSTTVLTRNTKLEGYESYLVEQWACSRTHPTFIITTYTGDPSNSVTVGVLSVPTNESTWSPQLRVYFKALRQYHARERDTNLGTLMITNLSGFPSSLTVIPIPEGDVRKHRELFFVNENLKRLGCSGRLGIKLAPPSGATQAKFHQLYRTSDKIPLNGSVIELVKLCQVALVLFGKLQPEYADGLLCDVTEKAINDWWVEFGTEHYNVEPHDGILGPTTVAALLGMLIGARNRLSAYNAPVAKDVFDVDNMKRGVAYFQKTQRLPKTRRLDRQTLDRLHKSTAKAASGEGWAMPRAVKSTVAELGGKGGEMVMGMVGGRDKAGIADVETVDIDRFVELVHGERSKWLWYGKPRKHGSADMFSRLPEDEGMMKFQQDDQGNYAWSGKRRESTIDEQIRRRDTPKEESKKSLDQQIVFDGFERDPFSKRAALRKATDRIEARSGFNRIKEAVGRRNHQQKPSKDWNGRATVQYTKSDYDRGLQRIDTGVTDSPTQSVKAEGDTPVHEIDSTTSSIPSARRSGYLSQPMLTKTLTETPRESESTLIPENRALPLVDERSEYPSTSGLDKDGSSNFKAADGNSIAGSIYRGVDLTALLPSDELIEVGVLLRRSQSSEELGPYHLETRNDNWWPRHLSFSIAEESVLTWPTVVEDPDEDNVRLSEADAQFRRQMALANDARRMRERLALLSNIDGTWVNERISGVQQLNEQADEDIQELEDMYYSRADEYQAVQEESHEVFNRERTQLQDALKDLETLGAKLEYEINGLRSKVDDVEDGVIEFEREIKIVEDRVDELEAISQEKEGWGHWIVRVVTGVGRPPAPPVAE